MFHGTWYFSSSLVSHNLSSVYSSCILAYKGDRHHQSTILLPPSSYTIRRPSIYICHYALRKGIHQRISSWEDEYQKCNGSMSKYDFSYGRIIYWLLLFLRLIIVHFKTLCFHPLNYVSSIARHIQMCCERLTQCFHHRRTQLPLLCFPGCRMRFYILKHNKWNYTNTQKSYHFNIKACRVAKIIIFDIYYR